MKLTECLSRINQILNYPALEYNDVSAFFDQAVVEINTSLKIGIPLISDILERSKDNFFKQPYRLNLNFPLESAGYEIPNASTGVSTTDPDLYYYDGKYYSRMWSTANPAVWTAIDVSPSVNVYGYCPHTDTAYIVIPLDVDNAVWRDYDYKHRADIELDDYLTDEWVILFLIPYVCFKYAARAGDSGQLYNTEFSQGFLQLQTSYNIPTHVLLSRVAGQVPYTELVRENLGNLNIMVPTRAITNHMKSAAGVDARYGGFYARGGWGL